MTQARTSPRAQLPLPPTAVPGSAATPGLAKVVMAGVALISVTLAGCGNPAERAYYRSRYVPEHIDDTYTGVHRAQWKGDPEVYELPSRPPALDGVHYERVNCDPPGPRFKKAPVVAMHDEVTGIARLEANEIGGMDKRPVPVGALEPLPGYAIGNQGNVHPYSLYNTTLPVQDIGDWDQRPRPTPGSGIDSRQGDLVGGQRDMAKDDYCMPDEVPSAVVAAPKKSR